MSLVEKTKTAGKDYIANTLGIDTKIFTFDYNAFDVSIVIEDVEDFHMYKTNDLISYLFDEEPCAIGEVSKFYHVNSYLMEKWYKMTNREPSDTYLSFVSFRYFVRGSRGGE